MAAVTGAVIAAVGTTASIASARQSQRSAKNAAKRQEQAAIESADLLRTQGYKGQEEIRKAAIEAARTAEAIPGQAIAPLQRFADAGRSAFDLYSSGVKAGAPVGMGALQDAVSSAGMQAVGNIPNDPILAELQRKSGLSGQAAAHGFNQNIASLAGMGVGVAGDIAGIEGRGADRLADIATQTAAGRAGALVGAAPAAQQALLGAGEARALSDYAGQRFNTQALESLSRLVGEYGG